MRQRSAELVAEVGPAIQRFPVAALAAMAFALYFLLGLHRSAGWFDPEHAFRIPAALTATFSWTLATSILGEARGITRTATHGLAVLVAGLIITATAIDRAIGFAPGLLIASGLLALTIAPYTRRLVEPRAFWRFNHDVWSGWLASFFAALLFGAGISVIVESLRYLFGVHIPYTAHEKIWAIACGLVGPIYWLSVVPDRFDTEVVEGPPVEFVSRMVALLAKFILVPLILAYAVILYAYAVKIGLDAALPKGRLGWLVLCFGTTVVATTLLVFPTRNASGPLVAFFWRFWPALLAIPLALLAVAVSTRIRSYGLTEARYIVVVAGVWLAIVTTWFALAIGNRDLRVIPGVLAILLLIVSAGPWGFYSWPLRSQIARATTMLSSAGLMKDGRVVATAGGVSQLTSDDRKRLSSTIDYLNFRRQLYALRPMFAGTLNDPFETKIGPATRGYNWQLAQAIKDRLGLAAVNRAGQLTRTYHGGAAAVLQTHPGTIVIGPVNVYASATNKTAAQIISGPDGAWTVTLKGSELMVEEPGGANQAVFDLAELFATNGPLAELKPVDASKPRQPLLLRSKGGTLSAALVVTQINVTNVATPDVTVNNLTAWVNISNSSAR